MNDQAKTPAKPEAKRPAIDAAIIMPEGWNSDDHEKQEATWQNIVMPMGVLRLSFEHGKVIEIDSAKLPHDIIAQAVMHGLKQKLVDAAAISRNPENGRAASIETKYEAVLEVAERLGNGEWNKRREGGATGGLLKRALVKMYTGRKTPEQIDEYLAGKSDKEKAALRKNPRVAEIIERMRKEDLVAAGEDVGKDLLAELDDIGTEAEAEEGNAHE